MEYYETRGNSMHENNFYTEKPLFDAMTIERGAMYWPTHFANHSIINVFSSIHWSTTSAAWYHCLTILYSLGTISVHIHWLQNSTNIQVKINFHGKT
jgi:hypothetical protein